MRYDVIIYRGYEKLSSTTRQASSTASRLIRDGRLCRDETHVRENLVYYFIPGTSGFQADR